MGNSKTKMPRENGIATIYDKNRFCLMTVGRSGSTSLMQALRAFQDIATPSKDLDCADDELLHPDHMAGYAREYERLTASPIRTPNQLLRAFFRFNAGFAYAGFKSMPNRHYRFEEFVHQSGLTFITLIRADIHSTVASFLTAIQTGCWRRDGGEQPLVWRFDRARHGPLATSNLAYVLESQRLISGIPNAIHLSYEELCMANFHSFELDRFFGRHIALANPQPSTHASAYLSNWDEYLEFIQQIRKRFNNGLVA